jgi:hypothetical protein
LRVHQIKDHDACASVTGKTINNNARDRHMRDFINEMWAFLRARKKVWLAPILLIMIVIGVLLLVAQSSVVAPFIYALF